MLAGISVSRVLVRELADLVEEPTAGTLEGALDADRVAVALTIQDRERILRALEGDFPDGLASCEACCYGSMSGGCARGWSSRPKEVRPEHRRQSRQPGRSVRSRHSIAVTFTIGPRVVKVTDAWPLIPAFANVQV